jgi:hypothetical protein
MTPYFDDNENEALNSWESDPDAWKKGTDYEKAEKKPERLIKDPDPRNLNPAFKMDFIGFGIRPMVEVVICEKNAINPPMVADRDNLRIVRFVYDGMKIILKNKEVFKYNESRNLWLKIK